MATGWLPTVKEINGINLDNYVPHQRSYNSVVFLHKRCLKKPPAKEEPKAKPKKEKKIKHDKSQQFNSDQLNKNKSTNVGVNNDSILEQTIRFAKNIVPLTIPPSEGKSPVFYTIKTSKKSKTKHQKRESSSENQDTYEKRDTKRVIEMYKRKSHKERYSIKESVSRSSNNTMDDLNNNPSLCCTLSELSDKRISKKEIDHNRKKSDGRKFVVSDSFEAFATETLSGDTKIKIHLMNDRDKHFLSDSIKVPVLNTIKDCIAELNSNNMGDVNSVQRIVKCNTHKLDNILDKLTCIEKKLDTYNVDNKSPRVLANKAKASKLEQLGEDLVEVRDEFSSEEEVHQEMLNRQSSMVIEISHEDVKSKLDRGRGEQIPGPWNSTTSTEVQAGRPNRIPARFCWTDAKRKDVA